MNEILSAVKILKEGGVIAYPGDTCYALGANIYDDEAIMKVIKAKGLTVGERPFPVAVSGLSQVEDIAHLDADHRDIIKELWPNPILFLLPKKSSVSSLLSGPSNLIGVIQFQNDIPNKLIQRFGFPITATSANPSGQKDISSPNDVEVDNDMLLKGICLYSGKEWTVVDLFNGQILQDGTLASKVEKFFS